MLALRFPAVALLAIGLGCQRRDVAVDPPAPPIPVVAPRPIPANAPTAVTSGDAALEEAWYERNFVEAYASVGRRNPRWDAQATELIRHLAPSLLRGERIPTAESARALELIEQQCDDPLVLYLVAIAREPVEFGSRRLTEVLERAVAGMHEVRYPRAVARWAASRLRRDYDQSAEGGGRRKTLDPVELRWLVESLEDGSYGPDEDSVLVNHLLTGSGVAAFDRHRVAVVAALDAAPGVDPWVKRFFEGKRHVADAWAARGHGYANEVTEEGWKGFREGLAQARESYTSSWRLRPDRPEAAAEMVSLALIDPRPGESPRTWFDRVVEIRLDYMPAYDYLHNSLRRRWGGSDEEMLAFVRECAETGRYDTQVPMMAFTMVEFLEDDRFEEARLPAAPEWPEMRRVSPYRDPETYALIEAVLQRYRRDPATAEGWREFAALQSAIAYKAERYDEAMRQLHDVGGQLTERARIAVGEPLPEARIEALASPAAGDVLRAGELYRAGKPLESVALLRKAAADAPDGAKPFIRHRLAIAEIEAELAEGRVVEFLPAAGLPGWSPQIGDWTVERSGSLLGKSAARGLLIVCEARVGPNFEIEADIDIASTSNGQFQAGIVFGEDIRFSSRGWSSFRVKKTAWEGEVAYFAQNLFGPVSRVERPVPRSNHVVVRSWNGSLWARVNGDEIIAGYRPEWPRPLTPEDRVGFGAYLDDNVFSVRYSNVRLRRLDEAPTE